MSTIIFCLAAGGVRQSQRGTKFTAPHEMRAIIEHAAACARATSGVVVCAAGRDPVSHIHMGAVVCEILEKKYSNVRTLALRAETFDTRGECRALAKKIKSWFECSEIFEPITVYIVARWWHLPRVKYIFAREIDRWLGGKVHVIIQLVPVSSRDWRMILEPFSWLLEISGIKDFVGGRVAHLARYNPWW